MFRNYLNYFTEIEERFQQRRGTLLMLSTLDHDLIESWREAEVPLEAVLRGIDEAFSKYETKKSKGRARRINGLAWCAQAVMEAAEAMREASVGRAPEHPGEATSGFEGGRIAAYLSDCREQLDGATALPAEAANLLRETAARLDALAAEARGSEPDPETLEATLRALEERLLAMLLATMPEGELAELRAEAARETLPFRSRMQPLQIRQVEQQFLQRRLLLKHSLPRLSLFYMRSDG